MGDPVSEHVVSESIERTGNSAIVYDGALVDQADERLFDLHEPGATAEAVADFAGRGSTFFVTIAGRPCVLRHYYRGGMIRHVADDSFFWTGEDRTRPFVEWRLLAELRRRDLPVPRPVAARYVRRGMRYRADLITERLPAVSSLAALLRAGPVDAATWRRIGATVSRFHAEFVCHADLNAHNIQVDEAGEVFLLDFDRGRIMNAGGEWQRRNLERLRRSLDKIGRLDGAQVTSGDWGSLLAGYRSATGDVLSGL